MTEPTVTQLNLIDEIISAYHTTRLRETPANKHIASKSAVKSAFEAHRHASTAELRARVEVLEEATKGPLAWLERWASHVGNCSGGEACTCGLTRAQYELRTALGGNDA